MRKKTLYAAAATAVAAATSTMTLLAAPAHADCATDGLHCPVPSLDDLEQQTCYVIDNNAAKFGLANEKLNAAYAMNLKFDLKP